MSLLLAHDWLVEPGGAEYVLQEVLPLTGDAPIALLFWDASRWRGILGSRKVFTSFLQGLPGIQRWYRYALPLFPLAVSRLRVPKVKKVWISSHSAIKGLQVPGAQMILYCYTPMRYAWDLRDEYLSHLPAPLRPLARAWLARIGEWEKQHTEGKELYAISRFVAQRIARFWGREARVLYPPVDTDFFTPGSEREDFFLMVVRLVPGKRVERALRAVRRAGVRLRVVGEGPLCAQLRRRFPEVEFLGRVPRNTLRELYRRARALLHPAVEDFGLVMAEALACGTPVLAPKEGAAPEVVAEGGVLLGEWTEENIARALREWDIRWSREALRAQAEKFRRERFLEAVREVLA